MWAGKPRKTGRTGLLLTHLNIAHLSSHSPVTETNTAARFGFLGMTYVVIVIVRDRAVRNESN